MAEKEEPTGEILQDLFQCVICFDGVVEPKLCTACGTCFCRACVEKWLEQKSSCPLCRAPVVLQNLGSGRLIEEATQKLKRLLSEPESRCTQHNLEISYYDETDSSFLCAECALLCPARRGHVFRKVGQLKAELKKEIQSTFEEIDFWIESWKSQLRGIRQKSDKVLINSLDSIEQTTEIIGSQISRDHEEYTTSLRTQDQDLNYLNAWATNSITMIKYDVESSVETDLDSSEAGIRESLAEILSKVKATAQTNAESLAASFDTYQEGTFQPFVSKTFTMQLISSSPDGMEKSILSEPLMVFGLEWRLRIRYYLSDDGSDSKLPFGVFLTLSESTIDLEEVQFEYGVELLGAPVHNFSFRNTARFRRGDSWGRNRFCTMGDLRSLRSIGNGETRPSLEFRVQVRPSNLVLRCQLQQAYIKHLEMRVS